MSWRVGGYGEHHHSIRHPMSTSNITLPYLKLFTIAIVFILPYMNPPRVTNVSIKHSKSHPYLRKTEVRLRSHWAACGSKRHSGCNVLVQTAHTASLNSCWSKPRLSFLFAVSHSESTGASCPPDVPSSDCSLRLSKSFGVSHSECTSRFPPLLLGKITIVILVDGFSVRIDILSHLRGVTSLYNLSSVTLEWHSGPP